MPRTSVGCNWTSREGFDVVTAATAWTPLSPVWNLKRPGGISYTRVGKDVPALVSGTAYCVRVLAQSDRDAERGAVVSDWTQIDQGEAAFEYEAATTSDPSTLLPADALDYMTPRSGTWPCIPDPGSAAVGRPAPERDACTRLPLFTWKPIPGARSYFVVVAKDELFTEIRDLAITQVPAYAPRNGRKPWDVPRRHDAVLLGSRAGRGSQPQQRSLCAAGEHTAVLHEALRASGPPASSSPEAGSSEPRGSRSADVQLDAGRGGANLHDSGRNG